MLRILMRGTLTLAILAGVGAVVARALGRRPGDGSVDDRMIPAIGGDTWPPVPVNPNRKD